MILKFGTKLDSDELYCVTKKHILLISPFICSFSPMKISVTDFSAPIGASVIKFCVNFQVGKVYCVKLRLGHTRVTHSYLLLLVKNSRTVLVAMHHSLYVTSFWCVAF